MLLCQTLSLSILKSLIAGQNTFVGPIDLSIKKSKCKCKRKEKKGFQNQISQNHLKERLAPGLGISLVYSTTSRLVFESPENRCIVVNFNYIGNNRQARGSISIEVRKRVLSAILGLGSVYT